MIISGIGTDIVEICRIKEVLARRGDRFAERILTAKEFIEYQGKVDKPRFLAKRFAAKEAAAKALGTGFRQGLSLKHIEVSNDELGKPELSFFLRGRILCKERKIGVSHLTISDERQYAVAFVILTRTE
ncbi:MAG: holo-ACP synthase [Gammaproteobacteria bacterium]|nr:holo-ACP synthase [Gammaproteobacteria bacterium]